MKKKKSSWEGGANELNILKDEEFANVLHKMIILLKGNCPISLRKKICFGLILREKGVCPKMTNCSNKGGGKANSFAVSDAFPFLPPPTELLLLLSHHRRRTAKNTTKFPLQNSKRIFLFIFEAMESAQTEIV